jgi:hypothetical protein
MPLTCYSLLLSLAVHGAIALPDARVISGNGPGRESVGIGVQLTTHDQWASVWCDADGDIVADWSSPRGCWRQVWRAQLWRGQ